MGQYGEAEVEATEQILGQLDVPPVAEVMGSGSDGSAEPGSRRAPRRCAPPPTGGPGGRRRAGGTAIRNLPADQVVDGSADLAVAGGHLAEPRLAAAVWPGRELDQARAV